MASVEWVGKTETLKKFSSSEFFPLSDEEKLRHHERLAWAFKKLMIIIK